MKPTQADENYSSILESISEGFVSIDRSWRYLYVNDYACKLLGRKREELLGRVVWEVFPHLPKNVVDDLNRCMTQNVPAHTEGSDAQNRRWYESHSYPSPEGIWIFFQDITKRKQMEDALRESEERFRLIADTMPGLVWTVRPDGVVDYINKSNREFTGSPPGSEKWDYSLIDPNSWPVHPDDLPATMEAWEKALRTGEPYEMEHRLRRFDGTYRWHLCRAIPARNERGEIVKWYAEATDIHEIREARSQLEKRVKERTAELVRANRVLCKSEKRLRRLSAELLKAQESERKLIAQELHDSLASQLTAIKYSLERKLRCINCTPAEDAIAIEDIIGYVRVAIEDTRRIMANLRPSTLDLGILPTINWFCREFQKINPNVHIEPETEIEENDIHDDLKIVIFRVLQEALNNILKHSQADRIKISLSKKGSTVNFKIEDNGRGFDLHAPIYPKGKKDGIGLRSMKDRVEISGGMFKIKSGTGEGTKICASWDIQKRFIC